jgi:hypothetical protein
MAMTDAELCEKVLGWKLTERCTWLHTTTDSDAIYEATRPPDFAHNIEACMKLVDAVCAVVERELTGHIRIRSPLVRADGYKKYHVEFHNMDAGEVHEGDDDVLEAAIRAAVVRVAEAHELKGNTP